MPVAHELPDYGHKSHQNNLQIVPESWRRLEGIKCLSIYELKRHIREWTRFLPQRPLDVSDLTIPCPLIVPSNEAALKRPATTDEMSPWIISVLKTTESAMHAAFPEAMENYSFNMLNDPQDLDKALFRVASWSKKRADTNEFSMTRLVVAFQPPWILSNKDIQMFQRCTSFPPFRQMGNAFPLSDNLVSHHRLWAKVYDLCIKQQTHWFVLTSYHSWAFGAFSPGWTHAFVTGVFEYNAHNPTIAELLMYWIGSAMHLDGTSALPNHPEPVQNLFMPIRIPDQKTRIDYEKVTESESHWDGKSEEAPSSAGVALSDATDVVSMMSNDPSPPGNTAGYYAVLRRTVITSYVAEQQEALPPEDPRIIPQGVEGMRPTPLNVPMGEWLV
ncbi:hypothetical protein E4T56_gene3027 [Termitomyces sp. T112]|nr:hypothetical protein E4T56_gene3027 [Termitomyces sp. T112]